MNRRGKYNTSVLIKINHLIVKPNKGGKPAKDIIKNIRRVEFIKEIFVNCREEKIFKLNKL